MIPCKENVRIVDWTNNLLSQGRTAFSIIELRSAFPNHSEIALQLSLNRLKKKGIVLSVFKGYYLIIPPQYHSMGILPVPLFIDGLMKHLARNYYIGLLNAATFHGSSHQQPQEYFIFTVFPGLRPTHKKGVKVNYISKKEIPLQLLENRKTETGYINISSPELTAADLIQFEKRIGGLNRAANVINDLMGELNTDRINDAFIKIIPTSTLQRLGFMLENIFSQQELADTIFGKCLQGGKTFFRIPLKTSVHSKSSSSDNRWKVINNVKIEIEE